MNLEITGRLLVKYDVQPISATFKKREFVLELVDETPNGSFTNYAKMQLVQNKTDLLDRFKEGDMVRATFNLRGNKYEKNGTVNYFTNLDVWRLEPAEAGAANAGGGYNQSAYGDNAAPTGGYNSGSYSGNANSNTGGGAGNFGGGSGYANSAVAPAAPASEPQSGDDLPF